MRSAFLYLFLAIWISTPHIGRAASFWSMFGIGSEKEAQKGGVKESSGPAETIAGEDSAVSGSASAQPTSPSTSSTSSSTSLRGNNSDNSADLFGTSTNVSVSASVVGGSDGAQNSSSSSSSSSNSTSSTSSNTAPNVADGDKSKYLLETDNSNSSNSFYNTSSLFEHKTYDMKLERLHPKRIDREIVKKVTEFLEYDENKKAFFSSTLIGNFTAEVIDGNKLQELNSFNLSTPILVNKRVRKEDGSFTIVPTLMRREPSVPDQFQGALAPPGIGHKSKISSGNHSHYHYGFNASGHHGHHGHHGQHGHMNMNMETSVEELPITGMTSDGKPIRGGSTVRPSAHASHEAYDRTSMAGHRKSSSEIDGSGQWR